MINEKTDVGKNKSYSKSALVLGTAYFDKRRNVLNKDSKNGS